MMPYYDAQRVREMLSGGEFSGGGSCGCAQASCGPCSANFGAGALDLTAVSFPAPFGRPVSALGLNFGTGGMPAAVNSLEVIALTASLGVNLPSGPRTALSQGLFDKDINDYLDWTVDILDGPPIPVIPTEPTFGSKLTYSAPPIRADIYMSAGPIDDEGRSCDFQDADNCTLYRLRLSPSGNIGQVKYRVELLRAPTDEYVEFSDESIRPIRWGYQSPAVSPDGTKLAYLKHSIEYQAESHLRILSLQSGEDKIFAQGSGKNPGKFSGNFGPPLWPSWFGNEYLVFNAAQGGYLTGDRTSDYLWAIFGAAAESPDNFSEVGYNQHSISGLLGPDTTSSVVLLSYGAIRTFSQTRFGDTGVRQPGEVSDFTDYLEQRVVTQGVTLDPANPQWRADQGRPRVSALMHSSDGPISTQEFDLGKNQDGDEITSAHHGDWSPEGDEILLYAHDPEEAFSANPYKAYLRTRNLYVYEQQIDGDWGTGTDNNEAVPAFEHMFIEDLLAQFNAEGMVFDDSESTPCIHYLHKYPQYCLDKDYIIFTLFCQREDGTETTSKTVGGSRVVIVHRPSATYWDLTALIEDWYGHDRGDLRGFLATCAARG